MKRLLRILCLVLTVCASSAPAADHSAFTRTEDVVYGRKFGTAPTLVLHGDADKLVPLYQAKIFQKRCKEAGATYKLIVKPGADHGWAGMEKDLVVFADWFDLHLRGLKKPE